MSKKELTKIAVKIEMIKEPQRQRGRKSDKNSISAQKRQEIIKRLEWEKGEVEFKNKAWVKNRKKVHSKAISNLKQMNAAEVSKYPLATATYASVESGISVKPNKKYCDFTGFHAKYTDKKTTLK